MQQNLKEVYRYLQALIRYRYAATILALLVMTVVGIYSFTRPKIYEADSTVFIEKSVIDSLVKGIAVTPNIDGRIRVLQFALSSRDLIVKTLEEIDSDIFTKSNAEQQNYIATLKEQTQIRVRGNDLFTVSLQSKDPAFLPKYINTLVGKYVEENISSKREEAYGADRFLDEQINLFKDKLEKAENVIIEFRQKQGLYFNVDEKSTVEEIKGYLGEIEKIELALETLKAQKKQLEGQLSTMSPKLESFFGNDLGFDSVDSDPQLVAMERKLSDLRLRYTDNYPEIVRLKFEIESLRKRLVEEPKEQPVALPEKENADMTSMNPLYLDVQQRLIAIKSDITSAQSKKQNFQSLIAKREKELHELPEIRKQLKVLIEERDSYQKVYQELLSRMGQSEVSKQMEISNKTATFRVVDPAVYPEVPVSPNMMKFFLLAVVGGLGCAAALIFLLENLDAKVRNVDMFKDLGIEVLAVIPNIAEQQLRAQNRKRDFVFFGATSVYWLGFVGAFAYQIFLR